MCGVFGDVLHPCLCELGIPYKHTSNPLGHTYALHTHANTKIEHTHTQVILDEVSAELNRVYETFARHTRRFSGKVSIAAHSLGGVICFDLLANQESVSVIYICIYVIGESNHGLFIRIY